MSGIRPHQRFSNVTSNRLLHPLLLTHIIHPTHTEHHVPRRRNNLIKVSPLSLIVPLLSLPRLRAPWKMTGLVSSLLPLGCSLGVREAGVVLQALLAALGVEVPVRLLSTKGGRVYCSTSPVRHYRQISLWRLVHPRETSWSRLYPRRLQPSIRTCRLRAS